MRTGAHILLRKAKSMPDEKEEDHEGPCEGPGCAAIIAFEVIGSELKLTVLHGLLSGPKRFTETHEKDLTFKGALEPETGPDPARCPNCGSYALYVDPVRGERVCDNCGFVVDEGLVDLGPDWTTFEGDDRIRAGPPPSVMTPDKGLGSMVGNGLRDAKGNPIDARSVAALNRLRRVSRWTRYDRTERALAPGLAQLSDRTSTRLNSSHGSIS